MNQKALLVLPLVVLIAAAVWLLGQGHEEPSIVPDAATAAGNTSVAEAVAAAGTTGTVDASHAAPEAATVRAAAAAVQTALLPIPDNAKWIEIRILDQATGSPLPGARVVWSDDSIRNRLQTEPTLVGDDEQELWRDTEALALRFGWQTTSNELGIARVTQTDATTVAARHESLYGEGNFSSNLVPPRDGFRLALVPDHTLQVQVLDAAGAPAFGIPIALAVHDADGKFQSLWDWSALARSRPPLGIARVPHMQRTLRYAAEQKVAQWRVRTHLPGFDDAGVIVELTPPPTDPVPLRLPPCGRVLARLEVPGQTIDPLPTLSLYESFPKGKSRNFQGGRAGLTAKPDADGWARFLHVPLGASFSANGSVFGGSLSKIFPGPMQVDGEVRVVLSPSDEQILLVGRLLDANRVPLAEQKFRLVLSGSEQGGNNELRTDTAGRFLSIIGRRSNNNKVDSISAEVRRPDEPPLFARAPGRELRSGTEDLGDLVLQQDALLVAGQFRIDGKPAKLERSPMPRLERFTTNERDPSATATWRRQQGTSSFQDATGRFEYRGTLPAGRYRLTLQGWGHLPHDPVEFTIGQQDLVIDLQKGAELAATMLAPKATGERLLAWLVPEVTPDPPLSENMRGRLHTEAWEREDGRAQAQWASLPPGSYRLEVRLLAIAAPLHTVDAVVVPGPPGGDARLVDIDLMDRVRVQTIRVFDPNGKPIRGGEGGFFPLGQDPTKELLGSTFQGSETRLTLPKSPIDLLVAVAGFQPREVRCDGAPLDVRLDAWPTVTLTFPDLPPLPEGSSLSASLKPQNPAKRRYRANWNSGELHELIGAPSTSANVVGGKVALPIGEGLHEVQLRARWQDTSNPIVMAPIQVLSTAGTVAVSVPPEALTKAIEASRANAEKKTK